ncbi:MAG: DUF934 domain-containing protein [Paracoccaceae bacterium]
MSKIVRDDGFQNDDLPEAAANGSYREVTLQDLNAPGFEAGAPALGLALDNDADPLDVQPYFPRLAVIKIPFPSFADGRGFSLARRLRLMGYGGRLRAVGHLIADQYPNARRCGFDEIEIDDDLAARQPANQWLARSDWDAPSYQERLRRAG